MSPADGELRACPFCGGVAQLKWTCSLYLVICQECGLSYNSYKRNKPDAISEWNRRACKRCVELERAWAELRGKLEAMERGSDGQAAVEHMAGNVVKEAHWKGEVAGFICALAEMRAIEATQALSKAGQDV